MCSQQVYKLILAGTSHANLRPIRPTASSSTATAAFATITVTEPKSLYIMNVKLNKIRVLRSRVMNPIELVKTVL